MQVLKSSQCESVEGGGARELVMIIELMIEGAKALISTDGNAGQSGGQISDTPAA